MNGKRSGTDWVGLGVLVALILGLGVSMNVQLGRMHSDLGPMRDDLGAMRDDLGAMRSDEIGAVRTELYKVGQRVARIEGMIEGPFPTGKHITPESK